MKQILNNISRITLSIMREGRGVGLLLMTFVMMVMSPTNVWAETITISSNATYQYGYDVTSADIVIIKSGVTITVNQGFTIRDENAKVINYGTINGYLTNDGVFVNYGTVNGDVSSYNGTFYNYGICGESSSTPNVCPHTTYENGKCTVCYYAQPPTLPFDLTITKAGASEATLSKEMVKTITINKSATGAAQVKAQSGTEEVTPTQLEHNTRYDFTITKVPTLNPGEDDLEGDIIAKVKRRVATAATEPSEPTLNGPALVVGTATAYTTYPLDAENPEIKVQMLTNGNITVNGTEVTGTVTSIYYVDAHQLTATPAVAATCFKAGNNAYWYCSTCKKYFSDEACTSETTVAAQTLAIVDHDYVNGFCSFCDLKVPATLVTADNLASLKLTADYIGYYAIENAGQLYWFAAKANAGETINGYFVKINGVLTSNIIVNENVLNADGTLNGNGSNLRAWNPIGYKKSELYKDYTGYMGVFDGKGHTISGLYINNNSYYCSGLFNMLGYQSTIKNVGVLDSYFKGRRHIGGICGYQESPSSTISGCYFSGTVSAYDTDRGGICGRQYSGTISDCYSIGNITSFNNGTANDGGFGGGICGFQNGNVSNCHSTAKVTCRAHDKLGGITGSLTADGTQTNCYSTQNPINGTSDIASTSTNNSMVQRFASGEVAYLLNGTVDADGNWTAGTGTPMWYQALGENGDNYPVLKAAADGSNTVYYDYANCKATEKTYTNTPMSHNIVKGVCTVCGYREYTPGDLNNYGNITITDVTLLIQLLNQGGTITNKAADVNCDGSVTVDDVEALRDKVLGVNEVTPDSDSNLLAGEFSVSATKKVKFTKGNLWYNASISPMVFAFEDNQYDISNSMDYNASHVYYFYWTTDAANSYVQTYSDGTTTADDVPFFEESTGGLTVAGTEGLYALSMSEWMYLINEDNESSGRSQTNRFAYANVNGTKGLLIFPDGYQEGTAVSGITGIATVNTCDAKYPGESIAAETWSTMEAAGVVFLPAAGSWDGEWLNGKNSVGAYWSSTPSGADEGYYCSFAGSSLNSYGELARSTAISLRLVKTAE